MFELCHSEYLVPPPAQTNALTRSALCNWSGVMFFVQAAILSGEISTFVMRLINGTKVESNLG